MTPLLVSVLIVNYFSASMTKKAVASVCEDKFPKDQVEIIIIDNSENDEERGKLENLSTSKNIKLVVNKQNVGFGRACNQAYDKASGKYILLLNPDAYLLPEALSILVSYLQNNPKAAAVGPKAYWDDTQTFRIGTSLMFHPRDAVRDVFLQFSSSLNKFYSYVLRRKTIKFLTVTHPVKVTHLSGGYILLNKEAVDSSGGLFDSGFFLYFEDSDLFKRITGQGYELILEPRAELVHYNGQCNSPSDKQDWKQKWMSESYMYFMKKYDPDSKMIRIAGFLRRLLPPSKLVDMDDLGGQTEPLIFDVPEEIRDGWVLELSPNRSLFPCVARIGQGDVATIPESAWRLISPGRYYARLGGSQRFFPSGVWQWEKLNNSELNSPDSVANKEARL